MKKKKVSISEFEAIKAGKYAVICSAEAMLPEHPLSLGYLMDRLDRVRRDLEKSHRCSASTVIVVEDVPSFVLKLTIPVKAQGALIDVVAESSSANGGNQRGPEKAPTLEESAMAESESIARETAKRSKGAIDVAQSLIQKAEQESLSAEEAGQAIAGSPEKAVTQHAYRRAQGAEQVISFSGDERLLGGGHAIPGKLYSEATFALTQCRVVRSLKGSAQYLLGDEDDPEWKRLKAWPCRVSHELDGSEKNDEIWLLRLAEATGQLVDVDVCIVDNVSQKGLRLSPLRIRNKAAIVAALKDRLVLLEE